MADVNFAVVRAALNTSTGVQSFTSSGFGTPKAAIFIVSRATADDTLAADAIIGFGFTDGTNQMTAGMFAEDVTIPTETARHFDLALCIGCNEVGGFGSETFDAAFSQWVTDGVEINITDTANNGALLLTVILINGSDVTAKMTSIETSVGNSPYDHTDVGFEPQVVFGLSNGTNGNNQGGVVSFGVAVNNGVSVEQGCIAIGATDNQTPSAVDTICYNNRFLAEINNVGTINWDSILSDFDASGFTVTQSAQLSSDHLQFLSLAIANSPDLKVMEFDTPTSTGSDSVTGVGFQPEFMLSLLTACTVSNTLRTSDEDGFGVAVFDGTNVISNVVSSDDNANPAVAKSISSDQFRMLHNGSSDLFVASFTSFDADGFTVNYSTAPATATKNILFAISGSSDVTAPDLSLPTAVVNDETQVTVGATTNEANGTYHIVFTDSGDESLPTNAEVVAGTAPEQLFKTTLAISAATANTTAFVGLQPGKSYGVVIVHQDAVGNDDAGSRVETTFTMDDFTSRGEATISTSNYDIPTTSVLYYGGGVADSGSTTTMVDAGEIPSDDYFNSLVIEDRTNSDRAVVDDSVQSTSTITFTSGVGTPNFTGGGQAWVVVADVATNDELWFEGVVTVSSESLTCRHAVKDNATGLFTAVRTATINSVGSEDGQYTTELSVLGVVTLTLVEDSGSFGLLNNVTRDITHNITHNVTG